MNIKYENNDEGVNINEEFVENAIRQINAELTQPGSSYLQYKPLDQVC
jgi:hypothetical protein